MPRFIGGDIGCGITVVPLGPIADRATTRAKQFSDRIRAAVPAGEAMRDGAIEGELDIVCEEARKAATAFAHDHPGLKRHSTSTICVPACPPHIVLLWSL